MGRRANSGLCLLHRCKCKTGEARRGGRVRGASRECLFRLPPVPSLSRGAAASPRRMTEGATSTKGGAEGPPRAGRAVGARRSFHRGRSARPHGRPMASLSSAAQSPTSDARMAVTRRIGHAVPKPSRHRATSGRAKYVCPCSTNWGHPGFASVLAVRDRKLSLTAKPIPLANQAAHIRTQPIAITRAVRIDMPVILATRAMTWEPAQHLTRPVGLRALFFTPPRCKSREARRGARVRGGSRESLFSCRAAAPPHRMIQGGDFAPRAPGDPTGRSSGAGAGRTRRLYGGFPHANEPSTNEWTARSRQRRSVLPDL
ncbi:MAG: hypothetical protein JWN40_3227 [Phycisphaerales bacterium]|nr:hypothetical protein [Phycisphaerales bacterium]